VAVRRRDPSTPLEEACRRGDAVCYVYGDVEWAPELEGKCRPVTFYVDIEEERRALEALLLYIARTRGLPWIVFNRDVLKVVGLCDAEPNACLTEEAVLKKVEAMKKTAGRPAPHPAQFPEPQRAAGSGPAAAARCTAETQGRGAAPPAEPAGRPPPQRSRRVGLTQLCWSC
jgi:hypothetical protein